MSASLVDGRTARRERNRRTAVAALLELYDEGHHDARAEDVALRAGLSARSLFRYFDDVEDLQRAACDAQFERIAHHATLSTGPGDPLAERVADFVDQRLRLHRAVGGVGRVARALALGSPVIDERIRRARRGMHRQASALFATELDALDPARRVEASATIDIMTSYEAIELLVRQHRLSDTAIRRALVAAVTSAIA